MNTKYLKPIARNLGEVILSAEGYCQKGSVATGSGTDCDNGGVASGGCGDGFKPSGNNSPCRAGNVASYPGDAGCTAGNNP